MPLRKSFVPHSVTANPHPPRFAAASQSSSSADLDCRPTSMDREDASLLQLLGIDAGHPRARFTFRRRILRARPQSGRAATAAPASSAAWCTECHQNVSVTCWQVTLCRVRILRSSVEAGAAAQKGQNRVRHFGGVFAFCVHLLYSVLVCHAACAIAWIRDRDVGCIH